MSAEVNVLPFHVINWTGKVRKLAAHSVGYPNPVVVKKCVYWFLYFQENNKRIVKSSTKESEIYVKANFVFCLKMLKFFIF